jgi:chemotaxis family two-component system sensor kinase Cph1
MSSTIAAEDMQGFLDHAVHDVRAALRKIRTSIELSDQDNGGSGAYPAILEGVADCDAILAGISIYSTAIGAAQYSFIHSSLELAADTAIAHLDAQIRETGGAVARHSLPELNVDKERVTDLFRILITNALAYRGSEPPRVEISAQADPSEWIFSVSDNGMGIAAKYQRGLFKPFYRLHGSEIPGVGLGLASCRKIVEAHRGRIWVQSEEGAGATFSFSLPVGEA